MRLIARRIFRILIVVLPLILIFFFAFRNTFLDIVLKRVVKKMSDEKGVVLTIDAAAFSGFSTVAFGKVSLVPQNGDTLFTADTLRVRPSIWTFLTGTLRIKEVEAEVVLIRLVHKKSGDNYQFIRKDSSIADLSVKGKKDFGLILKSFLDRAFNLAPQRADMKNIQLTLINDTLAASIRINTFHSDENLMNGVFEDLTAHNTWICNGSFSQIAHHLDVFIFPADASRSSVSVLKELTGTSLSFDTIHLVLDGYRYHDHSLKINGLSSFRNISLKHDKISSDTIKLNKTSISYSLTADESTLMLDSSSTAELNGITFNPFIKLDVGVSKKFALKIDCKETNGTEFFNSLPDGMFDDVRTIEADGTLKFSLNFYLDTRNPDSVQFDVSLAKNKFRIRKFNQSDLMKMSSEFIYNIYENDRFVRSMIVGPSNPYFTPIGNVSSNFKNAVLTSEDGSFFWHNGFNEEAFRNSIATNFKAGKFVRGGSTISMQLVKNIYLSRKKTIARKAEEALIVWMIESNRLYSKERMFEVYLNIIELGPNIYGIGEASRFYFNKPPSELSLEEGIFLASLLPHPKWFRYSFDQDGNLKPYMAGYYRLVSSFMLKKQMIDQNQFDRLQPVVKIVGRAREMVVPSDTLLPDDIENLIIGQ